MTSTVNILCIDSSTEACSVAVQTSEEHVFHDFMLAPREHTQKILPTVEQVVAKAKLVLSDIDIIAYGQGPGSFTGVRIGISMAQGLAFGLGVKMVGVSTLQAMSQQALIEKGIDNVYAAIDARMGEVYFAHYQVENGVMVLIDKEIVIQPSQLIELYAAQIDLQRHGILVGTGWDAYSELKSCFINSQQSEILFPDAKYMFACAKQSISNRQQVEPDSVTPVYLRDTVTWKKLPGRE